MQTLTREPPPLGEIPEFDRFVDEQLGEIGDAISEEQSAYEESLDAMGLDDLDNAIEMHVWRAENLASLRGEFWLEWIGAPTTPRANKKDRIIRRLKRQLRNVKRELDEYQYHSEIERAGNCAHIDAVMATRCPTCDTRVSDFFD